MRAIAPAIVVGDVIARRVESESLTIELCGDGKPGPIVKALGDDVLRRYSASGVHGSASVTLTWSGGSIVVTLGPA